MIFSTSTTLAALSVLTGLATASSTTHHAHRRHAAVVAPRSNATAPETAELYAEAAVKARSAGVAPKMKKSKKRGTCSSKSSSNSTTTAASSSASASKSASSLAAVNAAVNTKTSASSSASSASASSSAAAAVTTSKATTTTAAATTATKTQTYAYVTQTSYGTASSTWNLAVDASGPGFFNAFDFWDYSDPTHGTVNYVNWQTAFSTGLAKFTSAGNAYMGVDTTAKVSSLRNSIRLHSKYTYTGGMVILDAVHMPTGCATWPAFWSNGPNWPAGGEIDILEGINNLNINQVSAHTSEGCSIPTDFGASATLTTGDFTNTNCGSAGTSNQGCGERAYSTANAYGAGFNSAGGGVYVMKWDTTGIKVYFFTRSAIPADITAGTPKPSTWGTPMGSFPSTSCDPYTFFYDHFQIFDTTLCGDWAGNAWNYADAGAGQSQSCAAQTGYSTCESYVLNSGASFSEAYWEVKSVKWYQPS